VQVLLNAEDATDGASNIADLEEFKHGDAILHSTVLHEQRFVVASRQGDARSLTRADAVSSS